MSQKNNTESAAYKKIEYVFFTRWVILPRFCLIFFSWGDKCTAGGNLPPTLNCNEIFRILFFAIFGMVTRNLGGSEKIFIFSDITY